MTNKDIKNLFKQVIEEKDFKTKSGASKQAHYNYRHRPPKIGVMLEILHKIGAIKVTKV